MKMLVAVDLASEPESLVSQCTSWAARFGATLHLRTVSTAYWGAEELVDVDHYPSLATNVARRLAQEERRLVELLQQVPDRWRGTAQVVRGQPGQVLVELSGTCDLVVVGTHGRTGVKRLFLGSVAERLVRFAEKPVLVLRLEDRPLAADVPLTVVAPVDPRSPSTLALDRVRELLGPSQAVHILGVLPPLWVDAAGGSFTSGDHPDQRTYEGLLRGLAAGAGLPIAAVDVELMEGDNAGGTIVRYARDRAAHLVVMATHGRTGLDRLVFGSVAERTVRSAAGPVLVVR